MKSQYGSRLTRLLVLGLFAAVLAAAAAPAASADGSYRVRIFACSDGAYDARFVPHDTPLWVGAGWISGTPGLVQAFIEDVGASASLTDVRSDGTTVYHVPFGPIVPDDSVVLGGWRTPLIYNLPPLALGQQATLTFSETLAHPYTDLGLPSPPEVLPLQYLEMLPAGTRTWVCTITAI